MAYDESGALSALRSAKQAFLRAEVVEAGYSSELFVEYCDELKGTDVDAWTFEELKDCVENFKRIYLGLKAKHFTAAGPDLTSRQSMIVSSDELRTSQESAGPYVEAEDLEQDHLQSHWPQSFEEKQLTVELQAPLNEETKEPFEIPKEALLSANYYEVPCKQLLPTDLSRSSEAVVDVSK